MTFPSNFDLDRFSALRIELEGLEEWLKLEAIDLGEEVCCGNQVEFTVKYDRVEIDYETTRAKVSIENLVLGNSPIRLFHSLVASAHIRQTNWLVYEPRETLDLAQLQKSFRRVEEIIALLVGQYFRLDWPKLVAKFGEFDDWFTLYWKRGPRHETVPSVFFMLTIFPSIREEFGQMLDRWETGATKYGAGYDLYMASMQQPLPYPEHQFVNLVWAIESLHRGWQRDQGESPRVERRKKRIEEILSRFSGKSDKTLREWLAGKLKYAYEPKLEDRIVESFQRLPFELDPPKLRAFAERCARRRNEISHEGGSRPGEDTASFRSELRVLAEAFRYLFHALLLHEVGLSGDLLLKALTRGGIGSLSIVPALRAIGIELPVPPEETDVGPIYNRRNEDSGMNHRLGDKREMPDVPKLDFVGALAEIWFQINYAAYHLAYVRVYSQSDALRTRDGCAERSGAIGKVPSPSGHRNMPHSSGRVLLGPRARL